MWAVLEVVVVVVGVATGLAAPLAVLAALAVPVLVDLACLVTSPLERPAVRPASSTPPPPAWPGSTRPWWPSPAPTARRPPRATSPTWSGRSRTVVATPASFNNRAGLARAVNEHLADGTEVFVAEMGTYGPGEIADLCRWCPPDIAVITAIGPVHLERFGSEERIVEAKAEILERAHDVVLVVDDARLATLADRAADRGKRVWRCSATDRGADVCVVRGPRTGRRMSAFAARDDRGRGRAGAHGRPALQSGLCHRGGPGPRDRPRGHRRPVGRPASGRPPAPGGPLAVRRH